MKSGKSTHPTITFRFSALTTTQDQTKSLNKISVNDYLKIKVRARQDGRSLQVPILGTCSSCKNNNVLRHFRRAVEGRDRKLEVSGRHILLENTAPCTRAVRTCRASPACARRTQVCSLLQRKVKQNITSKEHSNPRRQKQV